MKTMMLAVAVAALAAGCAGGSRQRPCVLFDSSSCSSMDPDFHVTEHQKSRDVRIQYVSADVWRARTRQEGIAKRWTDAELADELKGIPAGGWVSVELMRPTIGAADPAANTFIVEADGQRLFSRQGHSSVPDSCSGPYTGRYSSTWWCDGEALAIPTTFSVLDVFVVGYDNVQHRFTIRPTAAPSGE